MYNFEIKLVNQAFGDELIPKYTTSGSAGLDLRAAISGPLVINPNQILPIPTGIAIYAKEKNTMMMLAPRSGLATKHRIILANGVGIIDSDYQNEIVVVLWNSGNVGYTIEPLERISQLIVISIHQVTFKKVEEFEHTSERGLGGFGHSGRK